MKRREIINYHHVGARAGSSLPILRMLGTEQAIWLYDADENCVDQVVTSTTGSPVPVNVQPFFIGANSEPTDFYLNYDLYTSSCYPYNLKMDGAYQATQNGNGDYLLSEALRNIERVSLRSRSLDELAESADFSVDYLSMDTQGGELNILKGANKILNSQCLAIVSEVNFENLYTGQPAAEEVMSFCRERDFRFIRLDFHTGVSWHRGPIGWRGKSAQLFGDVVFYKNPKTVKETYPAPNIALRKLAMIALVGGYFEYCLECLLLIQDDEDQLTRESDFKYVKILTGMLDIYRSEPKIYPPSFAEIYSLEEANHRFQASFDNLTNVDVVKVRQRYFSKVALPAFKSAFKNICSPEFSRLEQYLYDHSLVLSARAFRDQRLAHALSTAKVLGLTCQSQQGDKIDLSLLDQIN